jgi:hypothetical protein
MISMQSGYIFSYGNEVEMDIGELITNIQYIWTNHLYRNTKGCALVGTKIENDNNKNNNTTTTTLNVFISCLPTTIFV